MDSATRPRTTLRSSTETSPQGSAAGDTTDSPPAPKPPTLDQGAPDTLAAPSPSRSTATTDRPVPSAVSGDAKSRWASVMSPSTGRAQPAPSRSSSTPLPQASMADGDTAASASSQSPDTPTTPTVPHREPVGSPRAPHPSPSASGQPSPTLASTTSGSSPSTRPSVVVRPEHSSTAAGETSALVSSQSVASDTQPDVPGQSSRLTSGLPKPSPSASACRVAGASAPQSSPVVGGGGSEVGAGPVQPRRAAPPAETGSRACSSASPMRKR